MVAFWRDVADNRININCKIEKGYLIRRFVCIDIAFFSLLIAAAGLENFFAANQSRKTDTEVIGVKLKKKCLFICLYDNFRHKRLHEGG